MINNRLCIFFKKILCMHKAGLIPFKSSREYPIAPLWNFKTLTNLFSSSSKKLALIITKYIFFSSRQAYFKCSGKGLSSKLGSALGGAVYLYHLEEY
jgi:hypothetical protein